MPRLKIRKSQLLNKGQVHVREYTKIVNGKTVEVHQYDRDHDGVPQFDESKQRNVYRDPNTGKPAAYEDSLPGLERPKERELPQVPKESPLRMAVQQWPKRPKTLDEQFEDQLRSAYDTYATLKQPKPGEQTNDEGYELRPLEDGETEEVTGDYYVGTEYPQPVKFTAVPRADQKKGANWHAWYDETKERLRGMFIPYEVFASTWNQTTKPSQSFKEVLDAVKGKAWVDAEGKPAPLPPVIWERWRSIRYYSETAKNEDGSHGKMIAAPNMQVSTGGKIRRWNPSTQMWEPMKTGIKKGYVVVGLPKVGEKAIQKIVGSTFLGDYTPSPTHKLVIDHKNNNRTDNRVSNLRPLTYSQNSHNMDRPPASKAFPQNDTTLQAPIAGERGINERQMNWLERRFGHGPVRKHPHIDFWISKNGLVGYNGMTKNWFVFHQVLGTDEKTGKEKWVRVQLHGLITIKYSQEYRGRQFEHPMIRREAWGEWRSDRTIDDRNIMERPNADLMKLKTGPKKGDVEEVRADPRLLWWYKHVYARDFAEYARPLSKPKKAPSFEAGDLGTLKHVSSEQLGLDPEKYPTPRAWVDDMLSKDYAYKQNLRKQEEKKQRNKLAGSSLKKYQKKKSLVLVTKARRGSQIFPHKYLSRWLRRDEWRYAYAQKNATTVSPRAASARLPHGTEIQVSAERGNTIRVRLVDAALARDAVISFAAPTTLAKTKAAFEQLSQWLSHQAVLFPELYVSGAHDALSQALRGIDRINKKPFMYYGSDNEVMATLGSIQGLADTTKKYNLRGIVKGSRIPNAMMDFVKEDIESLFDALAKAVQYDGHNTLLVVVGGILSPGTFAQYIATEAQLVLGQHPQSFMHEAGHFIDHLLYCSETGKAFPGVTSSQDRPLLSANPTPLMREFLAVLAEQPSQQSTKLAPVFGAVPEHMDYLRSDTETLARFFDGYVHVKLGTSMPACAGTLPGDLPFPYNAGEFDRSEIHALAPKLELILKRYDVQKSMDAALLYLKKSQVQEHIAPETVTKPLKHFKPGQEGWITITHPQSALLGRKVRVRCREDGTLEIVIPDTFPHHAVDVESKKSITASWNPTTQRFGTYVDGTLNDLRMGPQVIQQPNTDLLLCDVPLGASSEVREQALAFKTALMQQRQAAFRARARKDSLEKLVWQHVPVRTAKGDVIEVSRRSKGHVKPNANPDDVDAYYKAEHDVEYQERNLKAVEAALRTLLQR